MKPLSTATKVRMKFLNGKLVPAGTQTPPIPNPTHGDAVNRTKLATAIVKAGTGKQTPVSKAETQNTAAKKATARPIILSETGKTAPTETHFARMKKRLIADTAFGKEPAKGIAEAIARTTLKSRGPEVAKWLREFFEHYAVESPELIEKYAGDAKKADRERFVQTQIERYQKQIEDIRAKKK